MTERTAQPDGDPYDAIVIGAGLCGLVFLAYARGKGLRCLAVEKQEDVGGLWNRLPTWQDLQNRREDISLDGVSLDGVDQPAVHRFAREWVRRFDLAPHIRLGHEVTSVVWRDGAWTVHTGRGDFRTDYLVVASGVQNEPWIPEVDRAGSDIEETHSFELRRPESLAAQRVAVVGGGASSQDLLELALEHGAGTVHWVYRSLKWFLPTRRAKQRAWPNLRELGLGQSLHGTRGATALMRWLLAFRYRRFGIVDLTPDQPFDFDRHQLIPGRATLLRELDRISRHRGEVRRIRAHRITLSNGDVFEADRVLWATGYRMDLRFLGLPEYAGIRREKDLFPRLGSLVRALDYPHLFFLGMTLIDSTSSTPFLAAVEAKTIVSHIQGRCEIPEEKLPHHLTYRDLIRYFAGFDRGSYPPWWRIQYFGQAVRDVLLQGRSLRVGT